MAMRIASVACAALMIGQGCAKTSDYPESGQPANPNSQAAAKATPAAEPALELPEQTEPVSDTAPATVAVKILDWPQTEKLIASKKGKVVVVDFWATYCPPCVKEFPNLVKLHKEHGDRIECISVSADYEGDNIAPLKEVEGPVLEQLEKFGATFDNVLLNVTSEEFSKQLGITSVPVVMVYDKAGKRVATFPDPQNPDEFTYAKDVLPVVNKVLAAP